MKAGLLIMAAVLLATVGFQAAYAKTYAANANLSTKVVWGINIGLLLLLSAGLVWYAFGSGAS